MGIWARRLQRVGPWGLYQSVVVAAAETPVLADWATAPHVKDNWGDCLNPHLIELVSGVKPIHHKEVVNFRGHPVYYAIGSGLGGAISRNAVVWGMGFMSHESRPRVTPKQIVAVRGPLSRQKYLDHGIECPAIYGDPALLLPRFYKPQVERSAVLGIVPHVSDQESVVLRTFREMDGVKVIDIRRGIHSVVQDILSCDVIASSSLHGMIAADAYGKPCTWIGFADGQVRSDFKYKDYLRSVGRSEDRPLSVSRDTTCSAIIDRAWSKGISADIDKLWDVCPFRTYGKTDGRERHLNAVG